MAKGSSNYYAEKIEREREWKCALWQMQLHAFVYGTHTPTHTYTRAIRQQLSGHIAPPSL